MRCRCISAPAQPPPQHSQALHRCRRYLAQSSRKRRPKALHQLLPLPPVLFPPPHSMQARTSPQAITPQETPRNIALSLAQNAPPVGALPLLSTIEPTSSSNPPLTALPLLSQALAADAAAMAENVNAREIALRLKLLQRVFRCVWDGLRLGAACASDPRVFQSGLCCGDEGRGGRRCGCCECTRCCC